MTAPKTTHDLTTRTSGVKPLVDAALAKTGGLLRLAPCWVPRSFLQPGKRLKLHPDDLYAFGLNRGGIWEKYGKWPVYSKFFDNMGPIPHHMHQDAAQAALVGQEGKPESYYFPPQHNNVGNNFPYTFMGFEPGTTKEQVRECIAN